MNIIRILSVFSIVIILLSTSLVFDDFITSNAEGGSFGGEISGPMPSGTHQMNADSWVASGNTVTFVAGTNIEVIDNFWFKVKTGGTLKCEGAPGAPVKFTHQSSFVPGAWSGFIIESGGMASFNYTIIEYANIAIHITNANPQLRFTTIRYSNRGINAESGSYPWVYNSTIQDCQDLDVSLKSSDMDLYKSLLTQTGTAKTTSVELTSQSTLRMINSTIADKYKYPIDINQMSVAKVLQSSLNHSKSKIWLRDQFSKVYIKNYLFLYVGTNSLSGEVPLGNTTLEYYDDQNKHIANSRLRTDLTGYIRWLETAYITHQMENTAHVVHYNNTDVILNYQNLFEPKILNVSMFESHTEYFINNAPQFLMQEYYDVPEDTWNTTYIDLWDFIDDDYDEDSELELKVVQNDGENLNGKERALIEISNDETTGRNRYLSIDLENTADGDNWTGDFLIKLSAVDRLGKTLGLVSESDFIQLNITPVNDPPMWRNMNDFHLQEDVNLLEAVNVNHPNHIYDADTDIETIEFSTDVEDKTNFVITIDDGWLNIRINTEHHTGSTNVTLIADDKELENNLGNYTLKVYINPIDDAPVINKSLVDFKMEEDSFDNESVDLLKTFLDYDGDNLTYSASNNKYIDVDINQTTKEVIFTPDPDWFGVEVITFTAEDAKNSVYDNVTVTVTGINDAPGTPVIIHPAESTGRQFKVKEPILFHAHANDSDIDNPDVDPSSILDILRYTWTRNSSDGGEVIIGATENYTAEDGLPEGFYKITVTAEDLMGLKSSTSFDIIVLGEYQPPSIKHISPLPDYWTNIPNARLEWDLEDWYKKAEPDALQFVRYEVRWAENEEFTLNSKSEVVSTKSFIVTGLRETKYFWTVIPYISDDPGTDSSGIWFFTYDHSFQPLFNLTIEVSPLEIPLEPGENATIKIKATNYGNLPDRFEIILEFEFVLDGTMFLSSIFFNGSGDGVFGMKANEEEIQTLFIDIPKDFKYADEKFSVKITVQSLSRDTKDTEDVLLVVLEPPGTEDGDVFGEILGGQSSILIYIFLLIVVIIIAALIIVFAVLRKHKLEEEAHEEEEETEEGEEAVAPTVLAPSPDPPPVPGAPTPAPAPAPAPAPVPLPKPAPSPAPAPKAEPTPAGEGPSPKAAAVPSPEAPALPSAAPAQPAAETAEPDKVEGGEVAKDFGSVMCGPCGATIPLLSDKRPLEVLCPECGNSFTMK
jgi:hypothetical protein